MADISVDADAFGASLEQILGNLNHACDEAVQRGVRAGGKTARKEWKRNARRVLSKNSTGRYAKSISVKFGKSGGEHTAEVGSKNLPGLPHLLEKGHATLGGGRTRAFPHIAPAFEVAAEETYRTVLEGVDAAIGGQ